jgi:hypothetical protein
MVVASLVALFAALSLYPLTTSATGAEPAPSPTILACNPEPTASPVATPSPQPTPYPCPTAPPPTDDLGPRPYGLDGLKKMFGKRCNSKANDSRTFFPYAWGRHKHGYVYYHRRLLGKVSTDIQAPLLKRKKRNAFDYGIWGYACRLKTGGTSWSVHSWGAAIDTNTLRNPYGQSWWVGKGAKGRDFGRLIPNAYMDEDFYWGLNFNDPMHFQYVSGY